MTYTYAVLDVPRTVFAAVRALLDQADYGHAFHAKPDGEVIDMHGIALRSRDQAAGPVNASIVVSTLISRATQQGRVEMAVNGEIVQMDLAKAREVAGLLTSAIEAAVSDELLYRYLSTRIALTPEAAAAALLDFWEMRQGSVETVYPS